MAFHLGMNCSLQKQKWKHSFVLCLAITECIHTDNRNSTEVFYNDVFSDFCSV